MKKKIKSKWLLLLLLVSVGFIGVCFAVGINSSQSGIVLTFDDRAIESWFSTRELFREYDVKATFFISKYDEISQEEIEMLKLLEKDGHEIGSHGLRHKRATTFVKENSWDIYRDEEILPSIQLMRKDGFNPVSFAYPYGSRKKEIDELLLTEFDVIRATAPTHTLKVKDQDLAYTKLNKKNELIFGIGIDGIYENSIDDILEGLDRARKKGEIITFYSHTIVDKEDIEKYNVERDKLETIFKYAVDNDMKFYTVTEISE